MVLNLDRARLHLDDPLDGAIEEAGDRSSWSQRRGATHWEGAADVVGGFPGFVPRGARLEGAALRITERYLLVDEGRAHGFGLPIASLTDAAIVEAEGMAEPAVRLAYRDGAIVRSFHLRFRASLFLLRAPRRAERALAALHRVGVLDRLGDPASALPATALTWLETGQFHGENVVWHGRATALLGRGVDRVLADVWLTTRSLIWGSAPGDGVWRLALTDIVDVVPGRIEDRAGTPVAYVTARGGGDERIELPFIFDADSHVERNQRERGAFLVGLRARGISLGVGAPLRQPWSLDVRPKVSLVVVPDAARQLPTDAPCLTRASTPPISIPQPSSSAPAPAPVTGQASAALPLGRATEAEALAALAHVLRAMTASSPITPPPPLPGAARLDAAAAELDAAVSDGLLTPTEREMRRARLRLLIEAAPRLRSLLELRTGGYLADADLVRIREAILTPVSEAVFGPRDS